MPTENPMVTKLLDTIVDHLDIPKSYYEKAAARHKSLGEWLCRPESEVAAFQPHVSPQGSFRYGTVIRPLLATEEYDLDNVAILSMAKTAMTQKQIKQLYGAEIREYARANGMLAAVEEKDRCWRLFQLSAGHESDIVRRIRSVSLSESASIFRTVAFSCRWLRSHSRHAAA